MYNLYNTSSFLYTNTYNLYNYICLKFSGQRFAVVLVKVALIMILSNYIVCYKNEKLTLKDNNEIHVFTYAADGLYLQFKKREQ